MVAAGKSSFRSTHSKQQLFCRSTVPSNNDTTTGGGDGTLNQTLFYMEDANFNVTGLVNTSGTVVERYAYSPYGQPKFYDGSWNSRSSSSYDNDVLYAGYRRDSESGLYQVRHRMYNPSLGKWMQRDPMGYVDGYSLYQYVGSEPVGAVDPWGLKDGTLNLINSWLKHINYNLILGSNNALAGLGFGIHVGKAKSKSGIGKFKFDISDNWLDQKVQGGLSWHHGLSNAGVNGSMGYAGNGWDVDGKGSDGPFHLGLFYPSTISGSGGFGGGGGWHFHIGIKLGFS